MLKTAHVKTTDTTQAGEGISPLMRGDRVQVILQDPNAATEAKEILAKPDSPPIQQIAAAATLLALWRAKQENKKIPLDDPTIPKSIQQIRSMLDSRILGADLGLSAYATASLCDAAEHCGDHKLVSGVMDESYLQLARVDAAATVLRIIDSATQQRTREEIKSIADDYTTANDMLRELRNNPDANVRLHVATVLEERLKDPKRLADDVWTGGPEHDDYRDACMTGLVRMAERINDEKNQASREKIVEAVTKISKNRYLKPHHSEQALQAAASLILADESRDFVIRELTDSLLFYKARDSTEEKSPTQIGTDGVVDGVHRILGEAVDGNLQVARSFMRYLRYRGYEGVQNLTCPQELEQWRAAPIQWQPLKAPAGQHTMDLIVRSGVNHPELRAASVETFRWMLGVGNETREIADALGDTQHANIGEQARGGLDSNQVEEAGIIADCLRRVATRREIGETIQRLGARESSLQLRSGFYSGITEELRKRLVGMPVGQPVRRLQTEGPGSGGIDVSDLNI